MLVNHRGDLATTLDLRFFYAYRTFPASSGGKRWPMHASQALALEAILEKGLALANARKPGGLLAGLGARISFASDLRPRGESRERLATGVEPLDRLLPGGLPKGKLVELAGRRSSGR